MRSTTGRVLATAVLAVVTLTGPSACARTDPDASAGPTPSVAAGGLGDGARAPCQDVITARTTARDVLASLSTTLSAGDLTPHDIAKAADDLKAALTAMHANVAAAAERTGDPRLKDTLAAYQFSVEQAIVVVEGADGDPGELAAALTLPELHAAEKAVLAACA